MSNNVNVRYELATLERREEMLQFIQTYFRASEPITVALAAYHDNIGQSAQEAVTDALAYPVSFVALDRNDQIGGLNLSTIVDLDAKRKRHGKSAVQMMPHTERARKIRIFLERIEEGSAETRPLAGCSKLLDCLILCVRPDHYRQGIAQRLVELSCDAGKKLACTFTSATATAMKVTVHLYQLHCY